jgi:hypothetical protein
MPEVDGVCEPGDGELEFALCGFDVQGVFWVPGVDGITYITIEFMFKKGKGKSGAYRSV